MNHHKVLLILSLICLIFIQCTSSDVKHNDRKIVKTDLVDDDSSNLVKGENQGHRSRRSTKPKSSKSIHKLSAKATKVINSKKTPPVPDILLINVQKDRLERVIGRLSGKGNVQYKGNNNSPVTEFKGKVQSLTWENVNKKDPCSSEPCFNNGVCEIDITRGFSSFICRCPSGFSGSTCQKEDADTQNVMSLHEYRIGSPRLTERHLHFSTHSTVLFIVAVIISFLVLIHACRTWSKKSDLKYAYGEAVRGGRDVPEPPDTLTISNQLCQDIFCCCCRPTDKKLSVIKKHYIGHRYPVSQKELDDIAAGRKRLGRKDSLGIIRSRLNDLSPEARDLLSDQLIGRTGSARVVSSTNPIFQGYVDTLKHVTSRSEQKISRETGSGTRQILSSKSLKERTPSASPPRSRNQSSAQINNRKLSFKTLSEPRVDLGYSSPSNQDLADNEESSSEDEIETEQQLSPEHRALLQNGDLEDYLVDLVVKLSELEASVTTEKPYELPEEVENEEMLASQQLYEQHDGGDVANADAVVVEQNEELLASQQLYEQHRGGDVANADAVVVEQNEDVKFHLDDIKEDEIEKYESSNSIRIQMTPLKSMPRSGMSLDSSSTEMGQIGPNQKVNQIITKVTNDETFLQNESPINETGGRFVSNPSFREYDLEGEKGVQDLKSINNSNLRIGMSTRVPNSSNIHSHQPSQYLQSGSESILRQGKNSKEGEATRRFSEPSTVTSYIHHIQRGLSRTHPYYSRTDIPLTESRGRISPVSDTSKYNREKITPLAKQPEGAHGIEQRNQDILDWMQSRITLTPGSSQTTFGDISSPQQFQKHFKELVQPTQHLHPGSEPTLRQVSEGGETTRPSSDPTTGTSYIHHIDRGLSRTRPYYSRTDILLHENRDRTNPKSETSMYSRERVTPLANNVESVHDNGQSTRASQSPYGRSQQSIQHVHSGSASISGQENTYDIGKATRPSGDLTTVTSYINHIQKGLSRTHPYYSRTDIPLPEDRDRTNPKSETSMYSRERVTPLANKLESVHDNGLWSQDDLDWAQSTVTLTPASSRTTVNDMLSPQKFQQHFKELVQPEEQTNKLKFDTEPYVYPEDLDDIVDEQPLEGARSVKTTFPVLSGFIATQIRSHRQPGEDDEDEENSSTNLDINNSRNIESNSQYLVTTTTTDDFMKDINDRIPVDGKIIASPPCSNQEYISLHYIGDDSDYKQIKGVESIADSVCMLKEDKLSEEIESSQMEVELPPLLDDSHGMSTEVHTSDQLDIILSASHTSAPIDDILVDREALSGVQTSDQIETILNASQTSAQIDDIVEDMESLSDVQTSDQLDAILNASQTSAQIDDIVEDMESLSDVQTSNQLDAILNATQTSAQIDDIVEDMESLSDVQTSDQLDTILNASQTSAQIDDILVDIESLSEVINGVIVLPNDSSVSRRPRDVNNSSMTDDYDDDDSSMY